MTLDTMTPEQDAMGGRLWAQIEKSPALAGVWLRVLVAMALTEAPAVPMPDSIDPQALTFRRLLRAGWLETVADGLMISELGLKVLKRLDQLEVLWRFEQAGLLPPSPARPRVWPPTPPTPNTSAA